MCSVGHTDLEVAVTAIAGEFIVAPLSGQEAERSASLCIPWQPRVVWFEELLKPIVASFALKVANGGRDVA